uniref:Retrotransposon protein, putative, unclassified n=1 Tax=Tanacetum cinerariifolium TaxID=118510 RepID=A0A6L2P769_TANCI|nr:retrotransposon protein, putative, unclassified [Tanacetum cinerariifolium]
MVQKSKLDEDKEGKAVDPSYYRGMIGTLLFLTASRPDLQFAICMCARYQARPTVKHLHTHLQMRITLVVKIHAISYLKRSQLTDYGLGFNKIPMYCDNKSAIALCCNNVQHSRTMDMTIDQQVELDEALVPHASRLRIGKSNFCLRSDITSKELTLQVMYNVLRLTSLYKAFLVTSDVPEIYMKEFWETATVHHHSIHFKMNNKKHIVNLEYFREMLHICPRIPNQTFDELLFEEEILSFLRYIRYNGEIKKITHVNINKLHQPWRSFAAVINKCLSGKSTGYDSLWLSQAQILCGMYHKKNVDFAYLLWKDFEYQVENKDAKKSNEMYYPMFIKVIVNFFMTKDPSISRRNKVNWHYVRYDHMFTTIKLISRHQNTQQFGAILLVKLTNEDIRNSAAYKEYYVIASGAAPPKTKASMRKMQSSSDTTMPPPTAASTRLSTSAKGKQPAKSSKAKGLSVLSKVALTKAEQMKLATKRSLQQTHISQASGSGEDEGTSILPGVPDVPTDDKADDNDDDDDQEDKDEQDDDDQDDSDDDQDSDNDENFDDESNDDESHDMNVGGDEGPDAEDDDKELYRDVNINLEDEQRNLYKALVDAYECDKIIMDTYGDIVTLKRHRDDADKDEEPFVGSDWGSKRRREGKEPESTSAPKEKASKTTRNSTKGSKSHKKTASESAPAEEPMQIT